MAEICLSGMTKQYPNGFKAVDGVDLDVADGEFLVLVGPSGCGKSTLLRMIAGLEEITSGRLLFGDRLVNHDTPRERDIAMVFQNYALYPHMTVRKNIGYSLRLAKLPKQEIAQRVEEAAELLELTDLLERKPSLLSGGQRQRVAMGRAIVRQPAAYLMDEPLSNLDAKLRVQMRAEIAKLQRSLGVTTIYVTHDQVEAMTMGTRVAVLKDGCLQQVASPETLYDQPANLFVASFIGSPPMNLFAGQLEQTNAGVLVRFGSQSLTVPEPLVRANPVLQSYLGRRLVVGIRPEAFIEPTLVDDDRPTVRVAVELVESLGAESVVHCTIDADAAETGAADAADSTPIGAGAGAPCIARLGPKTSLVEGCSADLSVLTNDLHFFDAESGLTLRQAP